LIPVDIPFPYCSLRLPPAPERPRAHAGPCSFAARKPGNQEQAPKRRDRPVLPLLPGGSVPGLAPWTAHGPDSITGRVESPEGRGRSPSGEGPDRPRSTPGPVGVGWRHAEGSAPPYFIRTRTAWGSADSVPSLELITGAMATGPPSDPSGVTRIAPSPGIAPHRSEARPAVLPPPRPRAARPLLCPTLLCLAPSPDHGRRRVPYVAGRSAPPSATRTHARRPDRPPPLSPRAASAPGPARPPTTDPSSPISRSARAQRPTSAPGGSPCAIASPTMARRAHRTRRRPPQSPAAKPCSTGGHRLSVGCAELNRPGNAGDRAFRLPA
jgi:hypothetical protein